MKHAARDDLRANGMEPVLERGHDAEVPAPAAQPPEQLGFSPALAVTRSPSAVTTSADSRLSHVDRQPASREAIRA
jgi:hypothetical protein